MTKVPDHIARMIRVDQAGEFGATRIYAGQLAVMGDRGPDSAEIAGMAEQEAGHRAKFDALMAERGIRPTALQPFWDRAGFALGAVTALIGPEAAMACTAAVECLYDDRSVRRTCLFTRAGASSEGAALPSCTGLAGPCT